MVGRKIEDILTEKANARNANNNGRSSYFSPIVIPVVSSFKRIYKTRVSRNAVFKGKPLHTIEEATELAASENARRGVDKVDSIDKALLPNVVTDHDDQTLLEIRHLFDFTDSDNQDFIERTALSKTECPFDSDSSFDDEIDFEDTVCFEHSNCASPSFSLIQQFEMAAKMEAASVIQRWYRVARERHRFIKLRTAAIVIQRSFRERLKR